MAGSGGGRGCASFTFNIEAICFGKGAALPDVICKPPPPFSSTENKDTENKTGEDEDDMLALKQDLRGTMKNMPYFLTVGDEHQAIERYSQKYQDNEKEQETWTPGWRRLPREMKPKKANKNAFFCRVINQILQKQLEELEKKDEEEKQKDEKDKTKDKEAEDDEAEKPEEYDEEEHEEENDCIASYFEDGDDFGAVSDDNVDEATC